MLKCVYPTNAHKLGNIAATYRAGDKSIFGSCPNTCPLLPLHNRKQGTKKIDFKYLAAELAAVPRDGRAWSYTHFDAQYILKSKPGESTLNITASTFAQAAAYHQQGYDTVITVPHTDTQWPRKIHDTLFIRCPAEINLRMTCQTCGNGVPLCSRQNRKYVIVFTAHGTTKQLITTNTGGCYATNFPCKIQWESTRKGLGPLTWDDTSDHERLGTWVKSLPRYTLLRHRIAGDIGLP